MNNLRSGGAEVDVDVHPLIYGQTYRLPPIETQIVVELTIYAKNGNRRALERATRWLRSLRELAYGPGDSEPLDWLSTGGLCAARVAGAPGIYCKKNGLEDDDIYAVIFSVTTHRTGGVDGGYLLTQALETLTRMLAPEPAQ